MQCNIVLLDYAWQLAAWLSGNAYRCIRDMEVEGSKPTRSHVDFLNYHMQRSLADLKCHVLSFSMDGKCAELQILRLGVRNPVKAMLIFKITSYAVFLGQLKVPCMSFSMHGKCAGLQIWRLGVRIPVKAMLTFKIISYAVFLGQLKMPCMSFSMNGKCAELGIWGLEVRTPVEAMLIFKMISYAVFLSQLKIPSMSFSISPKRRATTLSRWLNPRWLNCLAHNFWLGGWSFSKISFSFVFSIVLCFISAPKGKPASSIFCENAFLVCFWIWSRRLQALLHLTAWLIGALYFTKWVRYGCS